MLVTKFNVKLNQMFNLFMRKEFRSKYILQVLIVQNPAFHWSINECDRLTNKEIGGSLSLPFL